MKRFIGTLIAGLCFGGLTSEAAEKLKIVTSFLPLYCFTVNVAGDRADVENLLPANVGPHEFQLSPRDVRRLRAVQVLVLNGLQLETWLHRALRHAGGSNVIVEAATGLTRELITESPTLALGGAHDHKHYSHSGDDGHSHGEHGGPNPHIWLDPLLACHAVSNIVVALQRADPANAGAYASNAADYIRRLQALDDEIRTALQPVKNRALVTHHDAFAYFARRYDLRVVGVIETVADVDPTPKYLSALRRVVQAHEVSALFTEPQFSSKLAKRLARDLKIPVASLDTLETGPLQPDAYERGMRENLRALRQHLK